MGAVPWRVVGRVISLSVKAEDCSSGEMWTLWDCFVRLQAVERERTERALGGLAVAGRCAAGGMAGDLFGFLYEIK